MDVQNAAAAVIGNLQTPTGLITLPLAAFVLYLLSIRYRAHLRSVPGPFLASFSPLPRLLSTAGGHQFATHIAYHRKYGPVVRIGPNHVSFSDGEALSQVYNVQTRFQKSDYYRVFDAKTPYGNVPTIFSLRDEQAHKDMKRPIAYAYSMSSMKELEPQTDEAIRIFEDKLDEKIKAAAAAAATTTSTGDEGGKADSSGSNASIVMNLGDWLHFFSFDVITSITFSNMLGFMRQERDVENIIAALEGRQKYNSVIGQAPYLHRFLLGNRVVAYLANFVPAIARMNTARYIIDFTARQLDRYQHKDAEKQEYRDMLDRFKRTKTDSASGETQVLISDALLLSHASGNVFAGSDTTAISLRSMFYYFCKNARCYAKAVAEIDRAQAQGLLNNPVTFAESNAHLPYLQASMKEAMRLVPAVGQLLERVVPPEGVTIAGHFIPAGTVIGANPWVVARDRTVYGDDVDDFRPERWLDAAEASENGSNPQILKLMEQNFLAFGAGSRSCLGKNVSLLEMNKLVPQVLRKYKVQLEHPDREWQLADYWFVKQTGVICRISKRKT